MLLLPCKLKPPPTTKNPRLPSTHYTSIASAPAATITLNAGRRAAAPERRTKLSMTRTSNGPTWPRSHSVSPVTCVYASTERSTRCCDAHAWHASQRNSVCFVGTRLPSEYSCTLIVSFDPHLSQLGLAVPMRQPGAAAAAAAAWSRRPRGMRLHRSLRHTDNATPTRPGLIR